MQIGLGLWTLRSTAAHPGPTADFYQRLQDDARLAESLGFHSLWLAEHHFWYDGWCPSLLVAAAAAAAATSKLHIGTGVYLLPVHEPEQAAAQVEWLSRLSEGRVELGVGLGYRSSEYDAFGISRRKRGERMDAALDMIAERPGCEGLPIWVGGLAKPALARAATRGLGVMLPSTVNEKQLGETIERVRGESGRSGRTVRIGQMKYTWASDGTDAGRELGAESVIEWSKEYAGSWFPLQGRPGFESPGLLDAQMERAVGTGLIGSPEVIVEQLLGMARAGVELCVLHLAGDGRKVDHREQMELIAERVLPALRVPPG